MAAFSTSPTLHDFPALLPLGDIAEDLGLVVTLFGGAASRAVMAYVSDADASASTPFDLAPFSSDFDLRHSGTKDDSIALRNAIQSDVPFASWFRWAIQDSDTASKAQSVLAKSMNVPLRQICIGNRGTTHIPVAAMRDIENRQVTFRRNPQFENSQLARNKRDFEVFGFMMAVNAFLDMQEIMGESSILLDTDDAVPWLSDANLALQFTEMATSPAAISRFWNLLINQISRMGMDGLQTHPATAAICKAAALLPDIKERLNELHEGRTGVSVSRTLISNTLRVDETTPKVMTGTEAHSFVEEFLGTFVSHVKEDSISRNPTIDPALELLAAIKEIEISPNASAAVSERDDYDPFYSAAVDEFVEFSWTPAPNDILNPNGITACVIPHRDAFSVPYAFDVPAVGGVLGKRLPWVRVRLDDLIPHKKGAPATKAAVLILQARSQS